MCFVESEIAYASLPFSPSPLPLRVFQEDPAAAHEAVHGHRQGPPAESEEEKDGRIDGRKHWALRPQKPLRLIRDGEVGGGGSGILYLTPTRYTVTTRMILH